jgi:hypothetical protein
MGYLLNFCGFRVIEDVIDCKLDGGMLFERATRTFSGAAGYALNLLDFRR